jgi:hypothetical protein
MSSAELLTFGPRFASGPQASSVFERLVTHRSFPPYPPGRSEWKKSQRPLSEMQDPLSKAELLTVGPRFVGVPKVKSAFVTSVAKLNTKINTSEIVFFMILSFKKVYSYDAL